MIKHIVFWKIKDFAEGKSKIENLQIMQQKLKSLSSLPMVQELEVGINAASVNPSNYDIALIAIFNSMENLNTYQIHTEHLKVGEFVSKINDSRVCVDFEF